MSVTCSCALCELTGWCKFIGLGLCRLTVRGSAGGKSRHISYQCCTTSSSWGSTAHSARTPRAIMPAPTHELTRQLSGFAKELLHHNKLRVLCASRANTVSRKNVFASTMADMLVESVEGELRVELSSDFTRRADHCNHAVDIAVAARPVGSAHRRGGYPVQ